MRAIFNDDPHSGAGYGTIDIYGVADAVEPSLIIRRMSDGKTLSSGGWREGIHDIIPRRSEMIGDFLRLWLGPEVVNELNPDSHYELEMPGTGTCALRVHSIMQSRVIADNGVGLTPPDQDIFMPDADDFAPAQQIYEGVEETPEVSPTEPFDNVNGVVGAPRDIAEPARPPKRKGCLLLCVLAAAGWIGVGIFLWHGALNAPAANETTFSLEIIPKARDTSIPNDPGDEETVENQGSHSPEHSAKP